MKNILLKILFVIFIFLVPVISFAEVSKIVFITEPQTIKPDILSGPIKIQFQNANGEVVLAGETLKLSLESSSATGKFLNDSGGTLSTTINSNWTSRTFYYQDSTEGTFTITVDLGGTNLSADQSITISNSAVENNNSSTNDSSDSETSSKSSSSSSAVSSLTEVSTPGHKLEIFAGDDRTATPGSPIWFQATVKKNTTGESTLNFHWSFGDGCVGTGEKVSHTYKYPGEYVVVLSADAGKFVSVDRLEVKVIDPTVVVKVGDKFVEITNNSNSEINLFKWRLENQGKAFVFQPNTIILPKSSIKIDQNLFNLKANNNNKNVILENALGEEIFSESEKIDEKEISMALENIKNQTYGLVDEAISAKLITEKTGVFQKTPKGDFSEVKGEHSEQENIAESVASSSEGNIIYEVPKSTGFIKGMMNFLTNLFD